MEELFEEIYENVCNGCIERLEDVKRKNKLFIFTAFIVLTIINILLYIFIDFKPEVTIAITISIVVLMILFINGQKNYNNIYKQTVVENLVKKYNEKLYYSTDGITRMDYKISNFEGKFDILESEDRIYGKLKTGDNVQIASVRTYKINKYKLDGVNKEERVKSFDGMYGIVRLEKNLLSNINVQIDSITEHNNKDRIEMDSSEFEKYYDIITKDKIMAMRIFTADLIEEIVNIKKKTKIPVEIKIDENMIYFRYKCGPMFEPPFLLRNGLDKNLLKEYFKLIYYPIELLEKLCDNINNIDN